MRSMTGYGYAEYACENFIMTMELKSYNNRYLELSYNSPAILSSFENAADDVLKQHAQRGHVDLSVKLKTIKGNIDLSVDENAVKAYVSAAKKIQDVLQKENVNFRTISTGDILRQDGVVSNLNSETADFYNDAFNSCIEKVMAMLDASKDREGEATAKDLALKIDSIENSLNVVKSHAAELENQIKNGLLDKIHEMIGDQNYDENRILTEVAVMLMRYTINEETVRLSAHIEEFRRLLKSSEPVGKRMDFLAQEMNREINTIGSKSQIVEINFEVVNMKDCLENIREQIRNIE